MYMQTHLRTSTCTPVREKRQQVVATCTCTMYMYGIERKKCNMDCGDGAPVLVELHLCVFL